MAFMRRGMKASLAIAVAVAATFGAGATGAGAAVPRAELTPGGRAIAPPSAPPSVKAMIDAANHIRHRPYAWGGGHRNWNSRGGGGPGSWVRIYANKDHVYAIVAGLRWDTSMTDDGDRHGPGWSETMRSGHGFRLRHPLGILGAEPLI